MKNELGNYIIYLRDTKTNINSSRQLAKRLGITAQYMYDIEKGNRIPSSQILNKIETLFSLTINEKHKLYDLAASSYKDNKVPADIANFIVENDEVKNIIREMMKKHENTEEGCKHE